ncbi:hypothetical protein MIMGU_mgv11b015837mg [Erythranthe guttata]|uniref:Uncharacterized protein n=1 Tax=Erythranthe guttata TaxID=4155 RepID=A0A022RFI6_ERYGU|nr:hypothetical protein MIMGU_mgv11b023952mg [Erythranthe guttata]EYU38946.1 hypothetical protein MIMGU_mgv11b015837mg [Erythranthe guttata]
MLFVLQICKSFGLFMSYDIGQHRYPLLSYLSMVKDVLIDCEPILGYLHKEMDIIVENRTIIQLQYLHYVTRWGYLATMFT